MGYYDKTFSILTNANYTFSQEELILRLEQIKPKIGELREQFKKFPCSINYSDSQIRAAYLMSYYPYYISPIKRVLNEIFTHSLSTLAKKNIKITAFGCGAAPEIVGVSQFMIENSIFTNKIENNLLDYEEGWKNSRELLIKEFLRGHFRYNNHHQKCNILNDCDKCNNEIDCKEKLENTHLIVIQNCLNDISAKLKVEKIDYLIENYLHKEGILIIIDLNFLEIKKLMDNLELKLKDKVIMTTKKFTETAEFEIPELIKNHIYNGENNFIEKKYTHFYSVAFKK